MLTPIEIQNKAFKSGIGYDKKDVESYFREVIASYEELYRENVELNDKIGVLSEGIQYYKSIEKTLQKALVLAERTSDETKESARTKAKVIEEEAKAKAKEIILDARKELDQVKLQTMELVHQYDLYKAQFKQLAATQIELLNNESFHIKFANLDSSELEAFQSVSEKVKDTYKEDVINSEKDNQDMKVSNDRLEKNGVQANDGLGESSQIIPDSIVNGDAKEEKDNLFKEIKRPSSLDLLDEVIPKTSKNPPKQSKESRQKEDDSFEFIKVED